MRAVHIQTKRKARARSDNREGLVGLLLDDSVIVVGQMGCDSDFLSAAIVIGTQQTESGCHAG